MIDDKDVSLFWDILRLQYTEHPGYPTIAAAAADMSPRFRKALAMLLLGFLPDTTMAECGISETQYGIVLVKHHHFAGSYYTVSFLLKSVREHPDYLKQLLGSAATLNNRSRMADILAYVEALQKAGYRSEYALPDRPKKAGPKESEETPQPPALPKPDDTTKAVQEFVSKLPPEKREKFARAVAEGRSYVEATLFGEVKPIHGDEHDEKEEGPDPETAGD